MSRDGERVIELVSELASRMGNLVQDMVPPSAQVHLLNAQRELITALVLIYENRVSGDSGRRGRRTAGGAKRVATRRGGQGGRGGQRAQRVGKIPIE